MTHLIAISIGGFVLWLAANRFEWFRSSRQQYSQTQAALFAELCRAHALSRSDRTLLALIAQTIGGNRCCGVFVDPRVIRQFAENNPDESGNCLDLSRRLFGSRG